MKARIFLFALLAFTAGVGARSFIEIPLEAVGVAMLGAAAGMVFGLARNLTGVAIASFLVLTVLGGIFRFSYSVYSRPDMTVLYGRELTIRGYVAEEPRRTERSQRLTVKVFGINGRAIEHVSYTLITVGRYPVYAIGDELIAKGAYKRPENFNDTFDYISYLAKDGIYSRMAFPEIEKIGEGKGSKIKRALSAVKGGLNDNINRVLAEPHAALAKGLLFGERDALPAELTEVLRVTGVTHIIALSGYNITIVGRATTGMLLLLAIPFQISFWIAVAAIALFVLMTGASASVVRAGIMGILALVAQRKGREYAAVNALVFAGTIMIFHNPMILRYDSAFQLSFVATLGLIYLSPHVNRNVEYVGRRLYAIIFPTAPHDVSGILEKKKHKRAFLSRFKTSFVETLSAQLAVLPLILYLFGTASFISPLSNMLILQVIPYAMAASFAASVLGFVWHPVSALAGAIAWGLLAYQIGAAHLLSRAPFASVDVGGWVIVPLLMAYGLAAWRIAKKRKTNFPQR